MFLCSFIGTLGVACNQGKLRKYSERVKVFDGLLAHLPLAFHPTKPSTNTQYWYSNNTVTVTVLDVQKQNKFHFPLNLQLHLFVAETIHTIIMRDIYLFL